MSLTDTKIKALKPRETLYRIADGGGLCLEVTPSGGKLWRYRYRLAGKGKMLSLGAYPEIGLAEARAKLVEMRKLVAEGTDPSAVRKHRRREARLNAEQTFGAIKTEWLAKQRNSLAEVTYSKAQWLLGLASDLDSRPIADITPPEVLDVLHRVESRGTHETAHRIKQKIGQVFRYAVATGRATHDVTASLRGALVPVISNARAAVTDPAEVGNLLRAIEAYTGQATTHAALRLAPMLFARPGNLRAMEWTEIDFGVPEWRIPAVKMKMREAHVVPLPTQAVAILRELQPLTSHRRYVFPSLRTSDRPMSENTVNAALRRLGFDKETMTGHGFRAMASTRLNEMGWSPDVIERQLAHAERNKVRAAYNRAQYMAERRKMMQQWADYLDTLRSGQTVTPLRRKTG